MAKIPYNPERALRESWQRFCKSLPIPRGIGGYLNPKTAFQKVIVQNGVAVLEEMRESREALGLLCRLAYGGSLTEEQQRRLKVQLVDMAKVIPILGIFALPGGMLLLPILARSLPWNILPSAFRKELTRKAPEAENRRPTEDAGDEDGRPPGQSAPDRDSFPPR